MDTSMKKARAIHCSLDNVGFMSSNTNTGWSLTQGHQHLRVVLRALLNKEQYKPVLIMFLCIVAMKSWVGFFCIWLSSLQAQYQI